MSTVTFTQKTQTRMFLTRMKWKTNDGSFQNMKSMRIDCYKFRFKTPLQGQMLYNFIEYLDQCDPTSEKTIVTLAIWLFQHKIDFTLRFSWNRRIPVSMNLDRIGRPKGIYKDLTNKMEAVMNCDLDMLPQITRKENN